jgi:hypothetical protein
MTGLLWSAVLAAATLPAASLAYRVGYRRGRPPFPVRLRADLACHKRECLGEPAERVERDLLLFLGPERHRPASARSSR